MALTLLDPHTAPLVVDRQKGGAACPFIDLPPASNA